ncbi:Ig-like domain-containing protein [Dyadobacter sp. 22481]|uniref:Ig-like domain-containing protein n=1 Tax=Dyadobacter endophyticus TaxID=1749036 RepID=UPI00166BAC57|nr:Ig-like domain-containing protein [Dyadobacter endophyticus]
MKGICKISTNRLVRLAYIPGLTFFVCLIACLPESANQSIDIQWKNGQAFAIRIPGALAADIPEDSIFSLVTVNIAGQQNPVGILGSFEQKESGLLFTPMIPFTRGMHYDVRVRDTRVGGFEVPENNAGNAPRVIAIYPSADTLPENLLKIYLHFNQPMREGLSAKYIKLIKNKRDTIDGAFLDLQPELWNPERTVLTLWLDPGRIKRDLQPNKRLGAPMQRGTHYEIAISQAWTDARGKRLAKAYQKAFVTIAKDSLSPQPSQWTLVPPTAATKQALKIDFKEPLDHGLLQEVFTVQDGAGEKISGQWQIGKAEIQCHFIPDANWKAGSYKVLIEPRLEDLAGNNLVRPFDRDITKTSEAVTGEIALLHFNVK